jgi:hypothetical protein
MQIVPVFFRFLVDFGLRVVSNICTLLGMSGGDALAQLEALVDGLDRPTDGDDLARAFAVLDMLEAKLTGGVGDFDTDRAWAVEGRGSLPAWLRQRARRSDRSAAHTARVARRLRDLPHVSRAWEDGVLSSAQIDAVVANLTDRTVALFIDVEAAMVTRLMGLGGRETVSVMRQFALWADALLGADGSEGDSNQEPDRQLFLSSTLGGRGELQGHLDAESTDVVRTALRLAERNDDPDEHRTPAQRRGDALVELARFYLDHHDSTTGGRNRPHLNVVVDLEHLGATLGVNLTGDTHYSDAAIAQLLCDANLHRLIRAGDSCILDYGHATRTISPALWTALLLQYGGRCFFPDCDETPREGHHVVAWEDGGDTNLANVRPGCWHHHHLVHQAGWHQKLLPDGTLETYAPNGKVYITPPPSAGGP